MKKVKLLLLSLTFTMLASYTAKAQAFEQGNSTVSLGYGFPNLIGSIFKAYEIYDDYNTSSLGPIFAKYEYAITDNIGIGVNIGYSSTTVKYTTPGFDNSGNDVTFNNQFKFSSLGILARVNWHFGDNDKFDPYYGLGLGYRTASYTYSSDDPDDNDEVILNTPFPFGFETTVGARYYFTDNIGAYAELGFAKAPFQIGLVAKF